MKFYITNPAADTPIATRRHQLPLDRPTMGIRSALAAALALEIVWQIPPRPKANESILRASGRGRRAAMAHMRRVSINARSVHGVRAAI